MAKKKKLVKKVKDVSFEQALETLETIVEELEQGEIPLETSLEKYELGIGLLKKCHASLSKAERKIEILTGMDAEGNPVTDDYEHDQSDLEEKASQRSQRRSMKSNGSQSTKSIVHRFIDDTRWESTITDNGNRVSFRMPF